MTQLDWNHSHSHGCENRYYRNSGDLTLTVFVYPKGAQGQVNRGQNVLWQGVMQFDGDFVGAAKADALGRVREAALNGCWE